MNDVLTGVDLSCFLEEREGSMELKIAVFRVAEESEEVYRLEFFDMMLRRYVCVRRNEKSEEEEEEISQSERLERFNGRSVRRFLTSMRDQNRESIHDIRLDTNGSMISVFFDGEVMLFEQHEMQRLGDVNLRVTILATIHETYRLRLEEIIRTRTQERSNSDELINLRNENERLVQRIENIETQNQQLKEQLQRGLESTRTELNENISTLQQSSETTRRTSTRLSQTVVEQNNAMDVRLRQVEEFIPLLTSLKRREEQVQQQERIRRREKEVVAIYPKKTKKKRIVWRRKKSEKEEPQKKLMEPKKPKKEFIVPEEYKGKVVLLSEMGFKDVKKSVLWLEKHNGDIQAIVKEQLMY